MCENFQHTILEEICFLELMTISLCDYCNKSSWSDVKRTWKLRAAMAVVTFPVMLCVSLRLPTPRTDGGGCQACLITHPPEPTLHMDITSTLTINMCIPAAWARCAGFCWQCHLLCALMLNLTVTKEQKEISVRWHFDATKWVLQNNDDFLDTM